MTMTQEEAIKNWQEAKKNMDAWKEREMALRTALISQFDTSKEGTQNQELADGRTLKAVIKMNRKLGKRDEVEAALANVSPAGQAAVKWEPKLVAAEYNKLNESDRGWVDSVVTTKPGAPTLAVVEPKSETPAVEIV